MQQDCLVRTFHSTLYDMEWLETRFQLYCKRKWHLDQSSILKRLENAPRLERNVVYRELGRSNPASSLFFIHGEEARKSYMDFFNTSSHSLHTDLAAISLQGGQLADAMEMVEALRNEESYYNLYIETLQLFELSHIIHFCHNEYYESTQYKWVVDYVFDVGVCAEKRSISYEDSFANCGMLMKTVLEKISCVIDSLCMPVGKQGRGIIKVEPTQINIRKRLEDYVRKKKWKLQLH